MSNQGDDAQNLIKIDSTVVTLRMREKTGFGVVFWATVCTRNSS